MSESTPAARRDSGPVRRSSPASAHAATSHLTPKVSHTINFEGDWAFHGLMSDLGVNYALAPFHRIGFEIDQAGLRELAEHYRDQVFRSRRWFDGEKMNWSTLLLRLPGDAWVIAVGDSVHRCEIIGPGPAEVSHWHDQVRRVVHGDEGQRGPAFYMLRHDAGEFSADPIKNLPERATPDFLGLCYGPEIHEWIDSFRARTLARAGGLTIFDGPPGTGKTSLITQMIHGLEQTHVFYILPVSQDGALSSPELVPFWQKQNARHSGRVKVIVLEDAERLLWRRDGENREAVSSLLNIADGLIGRMLRLHVICSVNARMEDLDPAVLRPGRLMNHRRFGALDAAAAARLAAARGVPFAPRADQCEYTLAEVMNPDAYTPPPAKPRIGFA